MSVQTKDGAPVPNFRLVIEGEGPRHAPTILRLTAEDEAKESDVDDVVLQAIATLPPAEAIAGKPGVALRAICDAVKRSDRPVRTALKALQEKGLVAVVGKAAKQTALYGVVETPAELPA